MKRILVLTSGGDSSGMNAYIKALAKMCKKNNIELLASLYGFQGLVENSITKINYDELGEIQNLGGSIIKTSRSKDFVTQEGFNKAVQNIKSHNLECTIIVGGNGSFNGARDLFNAGVNVIAIPGTIDNDLAYTDKTLGYDTACQNAIDAIVKIKQTMDACDRGTIVEVMGRHCSDIAVRSAILCDADLLITEKSIGKNKILKKVNDIIDAEKKNPLIVVQENILDIAELAKYLQDNTKKEFRATVIGYLQRGGEPTASDKLYAINLACETIKCVVASKLNIAIGQNNNNMIVKDIVQAVSMVKEPDYKLFDIYKQYTKKWERDVFIFLL